MGNETRNRSFIGGGKIYLREVGALAAMLAVGNADSFNFAIAEDKNQRNFQKKGGGNIASQSAITDVTASVNALSFQPNILAVALRSLVNTVVAGAVTAEAHPAYKGGFIELVKMPDTDIVMTVNGTGGTPTYVLGTDYTVGNTGIEITEDSTIADSVAGADNIEVTYTAVESYDIEGITRAAVEYEILFDGFNDADDGKAVSVKCHKVKFSPSSALDLISEDYGSLPLSFEVLADTTKDGTAESQYFKLRLQA